MKILKFCYSHVTAESVANILRQHSQGHEVLVVPDGGRFAVCVEAAKIPASLKAALWELQRSEGDRPANPGKTVDEAIRTVNRNKKVVAEEAPEKTDAEKLRDMLPSD
jgi:hypothetical protein